MTIAGCSLFCGDCLEVMKTFPAGTFDLIVTSPPYNLRNSTGNGLKYKGGFWNGAELKAGYDGYADNMPYPAYVKWQRECLKEMMRLLNNNGAIFYNHKKRVQDGLWQDRSEILKGFPVRQEIIWRRQGGINFNDGYFLPTYESIFLIAKKGFKLADKANRAGDVWEISQEQNTLHPAPFPVDLTDKIISSTTARNILDPFAGSCTVGVSCISFNRQFTGIDISKKYLDLAIERLKLAKEYGITKPKDLALELRQGKLF